MEITIAFSPCPNDTFIFDALIHKKIDTEDFTFIPVHEDVETLNQNALLGKYTITKLSFHAFAYVSKHYQLLYSGAALGNGCGPILIAKNEIPLNTLSQKTIAIPGKLTTANFLLSIAFPELKKKQEMLFSEIESAILNNTVDAGVIIHENRFTYQGKGLKKIIDLGEYWENTNHVPIPLGAIAITRNLPKEKQNQINHLLRKSVEYALENPNQSLQYVKQYAQEMEDEVIRKHIALYVNKFTVDLGKVGLLAVEKLFKIGKEKNIISDMQFPIFI
ncbi:MAG TPA: 1,4-dihydroxy-6-naphthoate synthase [Chitinophagales bacterium]|nr:1,4-dihydroxy-6-naphthoate synthase [Chitinophagales bacterium]